jgi:hypothetical protein
VCSFGHACHWETRSGAADDALVLPFAAGAAATFRLFSNARHSPSVRWSFFSGTAAS